MSKLIRKTISQEIARLIPVIIISNDTRRQILRWDGNFRVTFQSFPTDVRIKIYSLYYAYFVQQFSSSYFSVRWRFFGCTRDDLHRSVEVERSSKKKFRLRLCSSCGWCENCRDCVPPLSGWRDAGLFRGGRFVAWSRVPCRTYLDDSVTSTSIMATPCL